MDTGQAGVDINPFPKLSAMKTESNLISQIKGYALDCMRLAVHSLRNLRETISDSFRMQRNYGRLTRWCKTEELSYNFPDHLNLTLERIKDLHKIDKNMFTNPPAITFISNSLPRFDEESHGFRLLNILKILLENNCKIDYWYYGKLWNDFKFKKALQGKISFKHLPLYHQDWLTIVTKNNPDYVWITSLWSIRYFEFITPLLKKLKESESPFKTIVDTADFHYKEFLRKYEMTGNEDDLKLASEFFKYETLLYSLADNVVVVSEEEKKHIQEKIKGIKGFEIIPNIHEIPSSTRPYKERRNICFVGSFVTKHNLDAVKCFIEDIFPYILKRNPSTEFHVLGYGSENHRKEFDSPNVKVIGSFRRLQGALTYYKLFVCPMTYGTGIKGKIGSAIEAGVPVVTTSIGGEGLPLRDEEECFIADSPMEFAEKCNQCLNDPVVWHNFSIKSRLIMAENFS
ncbi:MAG: glycosyltransferase family 4 protein, partial [Desulfobacteraceae bacterium]|nr:glycosyltransferase family 4 protein [Desulfobacteraceae bacterium]